MYSKIVESLISAHRMMEHVLTLIRLQTDMLHQKTRTEEFTFLKKAIGYMHNYPGLIHHPAEELIFERLNAHAPDTFKLCTKLTEEHKRFNILETTLLDYVGQAQNGDKSVCQFLKKVGNTYCMEQFDHIDREEKELFPQADIWLSDDEWSQIGYRANLAMDPLANPQTLNQHSNLYDYIMSTQLNLKMH